MHQFNRLQIKFVLFLVSLFIISSQSIVFAASTFEEPLEIKSDLPVKRDNEPVTTGIPIAKEYDIKSITNLVILDKSKNIIPSQFVVTARWGGKIDDSSKPIKWVRVTFFATIEKSTAATYYFANNATNTTASSLKITTDDSTSMIVNTGNALFEISKNPFSLFKKVTVNSSVITDSYENGIELKDANGEIYNLKNSIPSSIKIIEQGPLMLTLQIDGTLKSSNSKLMSDYILYVYFYANKSYVKIDYTIGNHSEAIVVDTGGYDVFNYYGKNSITFSNLSFVVALNKNSNALKYLIPVNTSVNEGTVNNLSIYQDSSGQDYWDRYGTVDNPRPNSYSQFDGYKVKNDNVELASGAAFDGYVSVSDSTKGVSVGLKDFWQNFPKGFKVDFNGKIGIQIFPEEYASDYNFRVGEEKTTEFVLFFYDSDYKTNNATDIVHGLTKPLFALATSKWYQSSGAVDRFISETNSAESRIEQSKTLDDNGKYAYYNDRTLFPDSTYTGSYYYPFHSLWENASEEPSSINYFNFYGWASYGNLPLEQESTDDGKSATFNHKYDFDYGVWLQFLRTGDYRWKDLGDAMSGYTEQLMLHDVVTSTGWDIARWKNAIFGHAQHVEEGDMNGQRNYLGPVMDTAWGVRGSTFHYYLTGYFPNKRFSEKAFDYAYDFFADQNIVNGEPRLMANLISMLTDAFEYTGDFKYQQLAQKFVSNYKPTSNVDSLSTQMLPLYLNSIARYANTLDDFGLTNDSKVVKSQLIDLVDWYIDYAIYEYDGWLTTYQTYYFNTENVQNDKMINNWLLSLADAFSYAYSFSDNVDYMTYADKFFHTASNNPFFEGSPLIYSATKEAVNHAVFGNAYMFYSSFFATENSDNLVKNGNALHGLNNWITKYATVLVATDNENKIFDLESGYLLQDIDVSNIPNITSGAVKITLTAKMKAQTANNTSGNPYLYGYLIGTQADMNKINTYVSTNVVKSTSWQTVTKEYTLPAYTNKIRLFMKKSSIKNASSTNQSAYFDDISITVYDSHPSTINVTKDVYLNKTAEGNYGATEDLLIYNSLEPQYRSLLQFDLSKIPANTKIKSAKLKLWCLECGNAANLIYALTNTWTEGYGTYANTMDGATWQTKDGTNKWNNAGGDFDSVMVTSKIPTAGEVQFDITALVQKWLDGTMINNGLLITLGSDNYYATTKYASKEYSDSTKRPMLLIEY